MGKCVSSGVQVGSLLPPLVSCELDVHNSLLQLFASLCPVGRSTCFVLSMNYLWMQTGVISAVLRPWLSSFSFCSLLCCSFPFLLRTGRRGNLIDFLSLFCSEWGYHRANLTNLALVISLENQGFFNCSAVIVACVFVITSLSA